MSLSDQEVTLLYPTDEQPSTCPRCNGTDMREDEHDPESDRIHLTYVCEECGFHWTETFTFSSWKPVE